MAAFNLFGVTKSEHPLFVKLRAEIEKNISESLIRRVDQFGNDVDWKVKGDDGSALFKTREAAIEFIMRATVEPLLQEHYGAKKPKPPWEVDTDGLPTPPAPGVSQPLDESEFDPYGNRMPGRDVDEWGNKRPKAGTFANKRLYGKTAQETAVRKARII